MGARYGFLDTRTGQVERCFGKEDALRVAANSLTGRYVAVVLVGGEWRELLCGAPARPARPRNAPRRGAGVRRARQTWVQRLWRHLRPDSGPEQPFVRHNG